MKINSNRFLTREEPLMIHRLALAFAVTMMFATLSTAEDPREVLEVEIDASADEIWTAFTTSKGLQSWVAPLADIDFKVGGKWRANYNADGMLGDDTTIENTILCYDPKRMISLKASVFPKDFEFEEAARATWSMDQLATALRKQRNENPE
jgi:uncharacterized protein YndB with AHSA1/START domain